MVEHGDAVGHSHDERHVVLDQDDGDAESADLADDAVELELLGRVHAGSGLVEQDEVRVRGQGPGDLHPALVGVRKLSREPAGEVLEADESKPPSRLLEGAHLVLAFARSVEQGLPRHRAMPRVQAHHHVFENGHLLEETDSLERAAHTPRSDHMRAQANHGPAVDEDLAGLRLLHARDAVEQGRLTAAVRADDAEDLASVHVEGHVVDGAQAAELLHNPLHLEDRFAFHDDPMPTRRVAPVALLHLLLVLSEDLGGDVFRLLLL